MKTLNPDFREQFNFRFPHGSTMQRRLHITMWDHDQFSRNDFMGAMSFSLEELSNPSNE